MRLGWISSCILGLAALAVATLPGATDSLADQAAASESQAAPVKVADSSQSRRPKYVTIKIRHADRPLIAGETGRLVFEAFLETDKDSDAGRLSWDKDGPSPVFLWVSTRRTSGVTFPDAVHPDRPRHHFLIKFPAPEAGSDGVLRQTLNYTVDSKTKAGDHYFWLETHAELKRSDGRTIHDTGITVMPFSVDTHLGTKILMLAVVAAAVFLFIVEWVRVDVVAMVMMVLLPELGLLNSKDTFRGLSSNAVVAIIGVMIISYALNRAGLVHRIIQPIMGFVSKSSSRLVVSFSALIAAISSVMQNTGAAVLFLPAIRTITATGLKIPISRVLMPIGMAAILGGTLTMIGTSPLILLNDILPEGMPKFGFLELTPISLAIVVSGIFFLSTLGRRMLVHAGVEHETGGGKGHEAGEVLSSYPEISGPYEIVVPKDYSAGSGPQEVLEIRRRLGVNIVAMIGADGSCEMAPLPKSSIRAGFALCVYGPEKAVKDFATDYRLELRDRPTYFKDTLLNPSVAGVVEGVVSPRSSIIGQTISEIRFRETFGVSPLALHQEGETIYSGLGDRPLRSGDTVLVHGTWEKFHTLQEFHQNFIIITPFEDEFHTPEKAGRALTCFLIALGLMLVSSFYFQSKPYNPIPLSVCLMIGAVAMVLTRVITISEAYHAVDWRTVFLLGGLIPMGMAVDQTGTAQWLASGIVNGLGGLMSPLVLLIVLACLSCAFTLVISNVGACTLLVPLGISIANQIGVDPRVAAIVVGLGVSNSFILPTHQVNALYMGPGEYRTKDYIKIGGILSMIYITALVIMTYLFYV